jgi:hypothetical protein
MFRVYRLVNLLSLDVALGAIITALFFAKQVSAPVRIYGIAALGLTVWIIYTVDRLMDVRHLSQPAASERHRFHQKHFNILKIVVIAAIVMVCILMVFIRPVVLVGGLILAPIIMMYLLLQNKIPIKELTVAMLYSLGVLLPAWPGSWKLMLLIAGLIGQLFLIALTNLLLFAWFEFDVDSKMGQASIATRLGKRNVGILLFILFATGLSTSLGSSLFYNSISWVFFLMWIALILPFYFDKYFEQQERYRLWSDAIFYIPLLGLLPEATMR